MSLGLIGGPLGCAGVAMLLAGRSSRVRIAGLVLIGAASSILGAGVAPTSHATEISLGVTAGLILAGAPLGLLLRHRPWLLAFAVLPSVPARLPLDLGGTHSQLELPLYLLAAAAGFQIVFETRAGDRRFRELGPIAYPLAAFVLWTGVSILWSNDVRAGAFELLAYFLPFSVIGVAIARLNWSRRAINLLLVELIGLAVLFAGVGVYQYATRELFWNPKVRIGNAYLPFFRVNSVFWDPSIYGRFLMIAIVAALVVVVRGPSRRIAVLAAAALAAIWVGLLLSYSQSSFAGLIVAVVLLMMVVWRRAALLGASFVVLVLFSTGVANPNIQNAFVKRSGAALNRATSDRAGLIYNGIRVAVRHPIVGVGLGAFRHNYASLTHLKGKEPKKAASHDTPVTIVAENGIIGLALYAWVLIAAFLALARTAGDSHARRVVLAVGLSLAAIGVHSLFYDHFFEDPTTWCLLGFAGLASATGGSLRRPAEPGRGGAANAERHPRPRLGRLGTGQPG
jgi:putative inorganic carbon (hco3(-)) transporter